MSWAVGYDYRHLRDIGYGVPAICDHPDCDREINRGLSYVCCNHEPYGGERGCGLYFCDEHQHATEKYSQLCGRCLRGNRPFAPKPDVLEWVEWKLLDESWQQWRDENADQVEALRARVAAGPD